MCEVCIVEEVQSMHYHDPTLGPLSLLLRHGLHLFAAVSLSGDHNLHCSIESLWTAGICCRCSQDERSYNTSKARIGGGRQPKHAQ